MFRMITCLVAIAAILATSSAYAQKKKAKKTAEERFALLDANKDEKLSEEEFLAKRKADKKEAGAKQFKRRDKNKDGSLSLEEFKAMGKAKK